ncbi:MAG: HK97-gp10 family putative phage morphogenesis protein [Telluria sp.]
MTDPTRIEGLGDLRSSFAGVKNDMRLRTSRLMVAAAGGVLRTEARRLARDQGLKRTGALIKNIVIKRERTPEGTTQYNLGVRHGRNLGKKAGKRLAVGKSGRVVVQYLDDPWYWLILESGRNVYAGNGKRRKRNAVKSTVPATPFIAPALVNKRADAIDAMATRLTTALRKANGT